MIIKYNKLHDDLVYEYKLKRLKDKDIAEKININRVTFYKWLKKYDSFRESYEEAKKTDIDCIKSMKQRAIGYDYYEEIAFMYKGKIIKGTIKKHMPSDYKSNVYMLKDSGFDAEFEQKKIENWLQKEEIPLYEDLKKKKHEEENKST